MSEENAELVRKAWETAGARGLQETAEAYWHADVEYVEDPRWPGASTYKGREAVLRCFQEYSETLGSEEHMEISVERVFDAGEKQVAFVRIRSRGSTSGVPYEHRWGYVVEVREGRVVHFRAYYEPEQALEAAGLLE
jgi:ketosteroid isomerase-like protein